MASRRPNHAAMVLEPIAESPEVNSVAPYGGRDVRKELCSSLIGQHIWLPDLQSLFAGWSHGTNPYIEQLRHDIRNFLFTIAPPLAEYLSPDAVNFTAQCWPDAQYEELRVATIFAIWIYYIVLAKWESGPEFLALDKPTRFRKFQEYAAATMAWCRHCLGLADGRPVQPPTDPIVRMFELIGGAMSRTCNHEQRRHLLSQLEFFFRMMEFERHVDLSGKLPDVNEYRQCRMGTSAINVLLCVIEYTHRMHLPSYMIRSSSMERLWAATNVICATTTDILQIRKRVADQQVDNLVIFLYVKLGDAQAAVNAAADQVKWAVTLFESASKKLIQTYSQDPEFPKLQAMIKACETACTANFNYSLFSPHHRLGLTSLAGGVRIII